MKITNSGIETLGTGGASGAAGAGSVGGVGGQTAAARPKADSVALSGAGNLVSLAKASASPRNDKVAAVAALVRSGQYETNTAEVSHAIVQGHLN